jgi:uncharacterized protein (DUF488 family)
MTAALTGAAVFLYNEHMRLFLIGYEGTTISQFVSELKRNKVKALIDVRELPLSRKKGFSKNALSQALEKNGIEYAHIRALGTPRPLRLKLRKGKKYPEFFAAYRVHLKKNIAALREAIGIIKESKNVALMCFERESSQCHRSVIAEEIQRRMRVTVQK